MKMLLGLLIGLAVVAAGISAASALIATCGGGVAARWSEAGPSMQFLSGLATTVIGLSTIVGLVAAMIASLLGLIALVFSVIARSWGGVIAALLALAGGCALWLFFILRASAAA